MHPARLLKSTPLRLALTFAVLFVAAFLIAGAAAYLTMKENLDQRLDRQILETFTAFRGLYEKDDPSDLQSAIAKLAAAASGHDRVYSVGPPGGPPLAGNIPRSPAATGWVTLYAPSLGLDESDLQFRIYSADIEDLRVTVGASLETTTEILETAFTSFAVATLAVLALAAAGGALLALRAQRRIELIAGTMSAISQGHLGARVPITRARDDIDYLSTQINDAMERLEQLVEGMRQVSSDIAHDLKTPIGRLHIAIEAALDRASRDNSDTAELTEALAAAEQINDTFDALLRITQIEAGARKSRFSDVDLAEVLETVFDAFEPVAEEQGSKLTLALGDRLAMVVRGDRQLLLQMIANLIENAIRHSPPGTVVELVGTPGTGADGPVVLVTDTGPGIPAAEYEKVFRRLYRLEKSRTTDGSGLGLSLVKAVADLHGARIELSSNEPGLRVSIAFPGRCRATIGPSLLE